MAPKGQGHPELQRQQDLFPKLKPNKIQQNQTTLPLLLWSLNLHFLTKIVSSHQLSFSRVSTLKVFLNYHIFLSWQTLNICKMEFLLIFIINQSLPWYSVNKPGTNANKCNISLSILGSYMPPALKLTMYRRTIEKLVFWKYSWHRPQVPARYLAVQSFDTDSKIVIILLKREAFAKDVSFSVLERGYLMTCCLTKISNLKIYTKKIQLQLKGRNVAKRNLNKKSFP